MRNVWMTLGLCSALLSCGTKKTEEKRPDNKQPNTPTTAAASSQAASLPPPKEDGPRTDYLVVVEQKGAPGQANTHKTLWLKASPEGYEELGSHDGVAASDGKAVWFWGDKANKEKSTRCECANALYEKGDPSDEEMAKCNEEKVLPAAAFYDVSQAERSIKRRGAPETPASAPSEEGEPGGEIDGSISFIATLGPYVFYSDSGYEMPCGAAHGMGGTSYTVVDLRDGLLGLPWTPEDEKAYTDAHLEEAKKKLCTEEFAGEPADGCAEESPRPDVTAIFPAFKEGKLKTIVQYTVPTFYAATDGTSGSYSRSARVPVDAAPGFLKDFAEVPSAVAAYWAKNPPAEINGQQAATGWSPITGDPKALEALRDSFIKAPSMELKIKGM